MQGIAQLLNTPSLLEEWLHSLNVPIGIIEKNNHTYTYTYMNQTMKRVCIGAVGDALVHVHSEEERRILELALQKSEETGIYEGYSRPHSLKIHAIGKRAFLVQWSLDEASTNSLENYRSIVDNSMDSIVVHDENDQIVYVNPAGVHLMGATHESECLGLNVMGLIQDEPESSVQKRLRRILDKDMDTSAPLERKIKRIDGSIIEVELTGSRVVFDGKPAIQTVCRNISERRKKQSRLEEMAYYDQLTQVSNRRYFFNKLQMELEAVDVKHTILSVLFIDLDNFKDINDQYGHKVGDDVLVIFTKRVQQMLRDTDTFSRMGGDEFVVLLTNLHSKEAPAQVAERMIERIKQPIFIDDKELHISVSIGIAMYPDHGTTKETLLTRADHALYEAKNNGRKCVEVYKHR